MIAASTVWVYMHNKRRLGRNIDGWSLPGLRDAAFEALGSPCKYYGNTFPATTDYLIVLDCGSPVSRNHPVSILDADFFLLSSL